MGCYVISRDDKGRRKLRNRIYWVFIMLILGSCYMGTNWMTCLNLIRSGPTHGLLLGSPTDMQQDAMVAFTIIGSIVFLLETINTITNLFNSKGDTRLRLHYELWLSTILVHIPLSACNFFIANCRGNYANMWQNISAAFSVVFLFARLVWFAHIMGGQKDEAGHTVFTLACGLYATATGFHFMMWRECGMGRMSVKPEILNSTYVYLLNKTILNDLVGEDMVYHGYNLSFQIPVSPMEPYLVARVDDIVPDGTSDHISQFNYTCDDKDRILPECSGASHLKIQFTFTHFTNFGPTGELKYGYAPITQASEFNSTCYSDNSTLSNNFTFYFFRTSFTRHLNGTIRIYQILWETPCLSPTAIFQDDPPMYMC